LSEINQNNSENEESLESRVNNLEGTLKALHYSISRRNNELLGTLLVLSLPMSDKRRLETAIAVLKSIELDDLILKDVLFRYLGEGIRSNLGFADLIEPLIDGLGFEKLWKLINKEDIKKLFGEVATTKWTDFERHFPCTNEVKR
jgi:hypothetical protein